MTSAQGRDLPQFPQGFRFGTSTAAYQIEGATAEDGRGPSIWDAFATRPGTIADGSSGAVATDHYHRYAEDVALLKGLGAHGYRLSVAWPRIQPTGEGAPNPKGLDFYDRLLDALAEAGIEPMVTLYHWDLPQALEERGGWLERATAERFAEYAGHVAARLGDRVTHWVPVNEPNVTAMLGYALTAMAPGRGLSFDALPAVHHQLLGHGLTVKALRAAGASSIGTATNHTPVWPASDDPADHEAAAFYDLLWNRLVADPILLGAYPDGFAELMPGPVADDLKIIASPIDFYGANYYNPTAIQAPGKTSAPATATAAGHVEVPADLPFQFAPMTGHPRTDFGWPVVPEGLYELIMQLRDRYPDMPPLAITEQGCAYNTPPGPDGVVDDSARIAYYDAHLREVARAIADGADVRAYYAWSLLDNFEWAEGYTQRFGLVWTDYTTLERVPKRSYHWFAELIAAQRA
ncbi:GH1 family beta-glucosidase [Actinocorallia sp. A-T 12471]|uniref:GH1 family beta-glucosidase n=1 Tax=Actinocorallia sp. A-T 12471 TaxID=3089813 RepID=UPI0029CC045D|nr:GH1 family beta-glucosidase [Actinocorallia sp. A-T 12471]MDX6740923.1 GH1 family beta-glucosidase [Actinocorallia sp. A-T 12471]